MKHTLIEEASLFFITRELYEEFSELLNCHIEYSTLSTGLLNEQDVIHNTFNLWLMMQTEQKEIMESMEKTMYYTGDFLIFDAMRKSKYFHKMLKMIDQDTVLQVQMAFFLSNQLNTWLSEQMKGQQYSSLFNEQNTSYFLLFKESDLWENRDFLDEVALFTKKVSSALADKISFEAILKKGIRQIEQLSFYRVKEKQA